LREAEATAEADKHIGDIIYAHSSELQLRNKDLLSSHRNISLWHVETRS
jgi:hypothetical protein